MAGAYSKLDYFLTCCIHSASQLYSSVPSPRCPAQALQSRFVDYIQRRKTVALDELAAEFGMRTAEVIKRVQQLEADGGLTGVMDDRGKARSTGQGLVTLLSCMLMGNVQHSNTCMRKTSLTNVPCPARIVPQFIFISPEEMQCVADFIRQRGRIAIAELAARSDQFVDLEPREVATAADLELPAGAVEVGA